MSRRDEPKHREKRRFPLVVLLIAGALVLLFLGIRRLAGPKTMLLTDPVPVTETLRGRGAFFFHLYAPSAFYDVEAKDVDVLLRYRVGSALMPLTSEYRERLIAWEEEANADEKDYVSHMLNAGDIVMPFSGMVRIGQDWALYSAHALWTLNPGDLGAQAPSTQEKKGLVFVDNRLFYCAFEVPTSTVVLDFTVGERQTLTDDTGNVWQGTVQQVKRDPHGDVLVIMALNDGVNRIQNAGPMDLTLERAVHESYSVPLSALSTEGESVYCYTLDDDQVAHKVPVKITRVETETASAFITSEAIEGEEQKALSRYDRLIVSPDHVEEGAVYEWD